MDKIRVLLANHPMMVPDAIRQLVSEQEDMQVVADCHGPMRILQETGRGKADAVVLAQEGVDEPGLCSQLLAVYPDLTLLCVGENENLYVEQLRIHREELRGFQFRNIATIIRTFVGR